MANAKELIFGDESRRRMLAGVNLLNVAKPGKNLLVFQVIIRCAWE